MAGWFVAPPARGATQATVSSYVSTIEYQTQVRVCVTVSAPAVSLLLLLLLSARR